MDLRRSIVFSILIVAVAASAYAAEKPHVEDDGQARNGSDRGLNLAEETRPSGPTARKRTVGALRKSVRFRFERANVKALLPDGDITWIGTSKGLGKHWTKSGRRMVYDNRSGLLSNGVFYLGKINGEIWVGTYGGGLSVLEPASQRWRNYNIPNGLADAFVYDVLKTQSGDVWIATWSGANRVVKGAIDDIASWSLYTVENTGGGLPNDWVYGLAEGRNGEVWFATEGGLARYHDGSWANWRHKDGLGAAYEKVAADQQFKNDPGQYSSHHARQKVEQGLSEVKVAYNPNYVVSLAVDREGRVWAGTWGGGLSRFDGNVWKTYTVQDGLPGNHVFALQADEAGNVWIGTSRGLAKYDGTAFTRYGHEDGLYSNVVFSLAMREGGSAWIGSYGGVSWFPRGLEAPAAPAR